MNESSIWGMSVRGFASLMILLAFCGLSIYLKEITGLKELALVACGYLFGKQQTGGSNASNSNGSSTVITPVVSPGSDNTSK